MHVVIYIYMHRQRQVPLAPRRRSGTCPMLSSTYVCALCIYIWLRVHPTPMYVCSDLYMCLRGFVFYPGGSAVWPQCWLCAVCAMSRVGCCVGEGGGYPVGVSILSSCMYRQIRVPLARRRRICTCPMPLRAAPPGASLARRRRSARCPTA